MRLSVTQQDRASGVLLGAAVGDALGAGYEFGSAPYDGRPAMIGGGLGGFAPGEWTDDTAQTVAIARVAATGADLRGEEALDAVAAGFLEWYDGGPADVGVQTSRVLARARRDRTAACMRSAARDLHTATGRSAGNGALMRTAPVALAYLERPEAELVEAAMKVAALTHHDPLAGQGAALWCLMIRHTVLTGSLPAAEDVLGHLPDAERWRGALAEAETAEPGRFVSNGWVVGALQAAWSAIVHTPVPDGVPGRACRHLQDALATAIGIGHDTDTVASIAGALLGARWGASAFPQEWLRPLHGWGVHGPGAPALLGLTAAALAGGRRDRWPHLPRMTYRDYGSTGAFAAHPLVDDVWIGGIDPLDALPVEVDAVVSLCRVGSEQVPAGLERYEVRLIDTKDEDNPNLDFVIDDAARTVLRLRAQGKRVYLHCVAAHSRTPTVAARVAVLAGHAPTDALREVIAVLPAARPRAFLRNALTRLAEADSAG